MSNNIDGEDRTLRTKVFKDSKELEEIEAKKELNVALSEKKIEKNNEEINNISEIHEINNSINAGKISEIKKYSISYEAFTKFVNSLYKLKSMLGEQSQEPFWRGMLFSFYSIRNTAFSTPCSFGHTKFRNKLEELKKKEYECKERFPEPLEFFKDTLNALDLLVKENRNPMIEEIRKCNLHESDYTVLIKVNADLFDNTKKMLENVFKENPDIISEQDLLKTKTYNNLLVIGSAWNFSSYVFESPRSWSTSIISYDKGLIFLRKSEKFIKPYKEPKSYKFKPLQTDFSKDVEFEIDTNALAKSLKETFYKSEGGEILKDSWPCRFTILSNEKVAFLSNLEGVDNAQICLVEDDGGKIIVERKKVDDFQERDVVLLRAEYGGDIIIDEANNILKESGHNVEEIRGFQKKWKEDFKNLIKEKGTKEIIKLLKENGARNDITSVYLTFWTRDSERVIGPQSDENFRAILTLLGKEKNFEEFIKRNTDIRRAHISAGSVLRNKLINLIRASDITQLRTSGFQEFKIEGTGSFEAYRIEGFGGSENIPRSKQDKAFPISEIK